MYDIQLPCGPPATVPGDGELIGWWIDGLATKMKRKSIKNWAKIIPKSSKNRPKIDQKLSKIHKKSTKLGPGGHLGAILAPRQPQEPKSSQKVAQRTPNGPPWTPQVGTPNRPYWAQVGTSWLQVGPSWLQVGSKLAQVGPRWLQVGSKLDQVGPSWLQVGLKWPKLAKLAPKSANSVLSRPILKVGNFKKH